MCVDIVRSTVQLLFYVFLEVFFVKVVTAVPMTHMGKPSNEGTVLRTQVILMRGGVKF